jgi:hypothetical protein
MANPFRPIMSAVAAAISTWRMRESSVSGDPGDLPTFAGSAASFDSGAKKGEEDNAADWRRRTGARLVAMPDQFAQPGPQARERPALCDAARVSGVSPPQVQHVQ